MTSSIKSEVHIQRIATPLEDDRTIAMHNKTIVDTTLLLRSGSAPWWVSWPNYMPRCQIRAATLSHFECRLYVFRVACSSTDECKHARRHPQNRKYITYRCNGTRVTDVDSLIEMTSLLCSLADLHCTLNIRQKRKVLRLE